MDSMAQTMPCHVASWARLLALLTLRTVTTVLALCVAAMKERMSYFREPIRIDQHKAIHEDAAGMTHEPRVFRRGELITRHGEKDQEKNHDQSALRGVVEHLAQAR